VDFKKQFMPYAWNLPSVPILFAQIYSYLASCIFTLRSTYCIFSQILGADSRLYTVHPAFMKSTLDCLFKTNCLVGWLVSIMDIFGYKTTIKHVVKNLCKVILPCVVRIEWHC
jgi:hypothetical protein